MIWKLKAKELSKENSLLAQVIIFFFTLEGLKIVIKTKCLILFNFAWGSKFR